jgi:hypothetical protein
MDEIDYGASYWFLVEVGHADGVAGYPIGTAEDLFKFQPDGQPLFSQVVLFASRERAEITADVIGQQESRRQRKMRLAVHTLTNPAAFADLLERLREIGDVHHVTFTYGSERPDNTVPIDFAIIGFGSA